jgi:hypothetical protein
MTNVLQERFGELLFARIRAARYPSVAHMDILEAIATPQVLVEYTLHLLERIEADKYPSIPMMERVEALVARSGLALQLAEARGKDA